MAAAGWGGAIAAAAGNFQSLAENLYGAGQARKAASRAFKRQIWLLSNRNQLMVEDLKKAGINPLYAYGGGGAGGGFPSVNQATVPGVHGGSVRDVVEASQNAMARVQELKNMREEFRNLEKTGRLIDAQKGAANAKGTRDAAETDYLQNMADNIIYNRENFLNQARWEVEKAKNMAEYYGSSATNLNWDTFMKRQMAPAAENLADFYSGDFGRFIQRAKETGSALQSWVPRIGIGIGRVGGQDKYERYRTRGRPLFGQPAGTP